MSLIYKFLPTERISYLQDELLRITQPSDLNDPFECVPIPPTIEEVEYIFSESVKSTLENLKHSQKEKYDYLEKKLKEEFSKINNENPGGFRTKFFNEALENINKKIGVLSLSRRWDSTLMWSHYSNSHKGFCIGFNAKESFFQDYRAMSNSNKIFLPVIYNNNRVKVPATKGEKIDPNVLLTKSKNWEYEEEERLLVLLNNADKVINSLPYNIYLIKVPHIMIREIIAGANINEENLLILKNFCKLKSIKLYQSKISDQKIDMERIEL